MNRTRSFSVAVLVGALLIPMAAEAAGRTVSGSVLIPIVESAAGNPGAEAARCAYATDREKSQGVLGFVVPITAAERDGTRGVTLRGPRYGSLFRVIFYGEMPDCGESSAPLGSMQTQSGAGEVQGEIPKGSKFALIVLQSVVSPAPLSCYVLPPVCGSVFLSQPASEFELVIHG